MAFFDKIKKPDLSGIANKLKDTASDAFDKGKKLAETCAESIESTSEVVSQKIKDTASDVCDKGKNLAETCAGGLSNASSEVGQKIKSVSSEAAEKGKKLSDNFMEDISKASSAVGSVASDLAENTLGGIQVAGEAISKVASSMKGKLEGLSVMGMFESINFSSIIENLHSFGDKFNQSSFWQKIKEVASKVGGVLIYNVMLLFNLATSSEVTLKDKTMIVGALGYFIFPMDGIPDMIAGIGYVDDMGSIAYVLGKVQSSITPNIEKAARERTEQIFGRSDESWYQNPEEAYASSKDLADDVNGKYGEAMNLVSKLKK